jgi:hypothetical protein
MGKCFFRQQLSRRCRFNLIFSVFRNSYKKHGLNATVRRASGWAMIRDWAINKEVDATHMLSPMPLAITLGAGSQSVPYLMPAVENIKGVKSAKDMKGFRFCVPFTYSMHNYLLRYYLAEEGLHLDKDVQIRVVPPPEMVVNLAADNVDGYLGPDPVQPAGGVRERRLHLDVVQGTLAGPPLLRLRNFSGVRKNLPEYVSSVLQIDRGRNSLRLEAGEPKGNSQGNRAAQLST